MLDGTHGQDMEEAHGQYGSGNVEHAASGPGGTIPVSTVRALEPTGPYVPMTVIRMSTMFVLNAVVFDALLEVCMIEFEVK